MLLGSPLLRLIAGTMMKLGNTNRIFNFIRHNPALDSQSAVFRGQDAVLLNFTRDHDLISGSRFWNLDPVIGNVISGIVVQQIEQGMNPQFVEGRQALSRDDRVNRLDGGCDGHSSELNNITTGVR